MKEALRTSLGCKVASRSSAGVLSMFSWREIGAWCPLKGEKVLQAVLGLCMCRGTVDVSSSSFGVGPRIANR